MKIRYVPFLIVIISVISACDVQSSLDAMYEDKKKPDIYLGSGIKLKISEDEVGTVFGYEDCPVSEWGGWLFGPSIQNTGCSLISGKSVVDVRVILSDGSVIKESWRITEGYGPSVTGLSVERPNGWKLRETGS